MWLWCSVRVKNSTPNLDRGRENFEGAWGRESSPSLCIFVIHVCQKGKVILISISHASRRGRREEFALTRAHSQFRIKLPAETGGGISSSFLLCLQNALSLVKRTDFLTITKSTLVPKGITFDPSGIRISESKVATPKTWPCWGHDALHVFPFFDEIFLSILSVSPQTNWHCQNLIHPLFNIWISIMCHNSKLFPVFPRLKCKFSSGYFLCPRPLLFPPLSFQDSPEKQGKKETQKQIVVHKKWIFRPSSCLHQLSTVSPHYTSDARSTPLWYFFLKYWLTMFWNEQIKSYSSDIRLFFSRTFFNTFFIGLKPGNLTKKFRKSTTFGVTPRHARCQRRQVINYERGGYLDGRLFWRAHLLTHLWPEDRWRCFSSASVRPSAVNKRGTCLDESRNVAREQLLLSYLQYVILNTLRKV